MIAFRTALCAIVFRDGNSGSSAVCIKRCGWSDCSCRREIGLWNMEDKEYASVCSNQSTGSEWWPMNETNEELDYYYCMPPYCTLDSFNGSTRMEFPAGAAVEVSVTLLVCVLSACQ